MPTVTAAGNSAEVPEGTRLVRAIERDLGIDIMHACGGFARCTTCRVTFIDGEPDRMTVAERDRLEAKELLGAFRLSCQIEVNDDMSVDPAMQVSTTDFDDPGDTPAESITPPPEWIQAR